LHLQRLILSSLAEFSVQVHIAHPALWKHTGAHVAAPAGYECTTIIWHSCNWQYYAVIREGMMPSGINGGLRLRLNPPYGLPVQFVAKIFISENPK
jgi:hypothetical protein